MKLRQMTAEIFSLLKVPIGHKMGREDLRGEYEPVYPTGDDVVLPE